MICYTALYILHFSALLLHYKFKNVSNIEVQVIKQPHQNMCIASVVCIFVSVELNNTGYAWAVKAICLYRGSQDKWNSVCLEQSIHRTREP